MFTSAANLMFLPVRNLCCLVKNRPFISLAAGFGFLLVIWFGTFLLFPVSLRPAQEALRLDLLPEAKAAIDLFLKKHPNDSEGHLLAARIERLRGDSLDAEKHLDEYKRIEGSTSRGQLEWILVRAMGGDLLDPEVEEGLKYSLQKKDASSNLILEAMVFGYMKEFRFRISFRYLEKWLELEPNSVRALHWLGWVRENLNPNYSDAAKEDYQRALEFSPKHLEARLRLVSVLLSEKSVPEAAANLKILERDHPDHPEVIYLLAQCRAFEGQAEEADKLLDRLLAMQPKNARAFHQRGQLALGESDKEKWFRKAIQIDPSFQEARYSLFTCLQKQPNRGREAAAEKKKYDESTKDWKTLEMTLTDLERSPSNPDLLARAGKLLLARNPMIGQQFLHKALAVNRDHAHAHAILAEYFEKTNQSEKAALHRKKLAPPK